MVQRSMQHQEFFIEQHGRNHAEMMHSTDRNHSDLMRATDRNHLEMVGMFTATLKAFTEVGREFLKK